MNGNKVFHALHSVVSVVWGWSSFGLTKFISNYITPRDKGLFLDSVAAEENQQEQMLQSYFHCLHGSYITFLRMVVNFIFQ